MVSHVFPVGTTVRCVQALSSDGKLMQGREYTVQDVSASGNVRLQGVPDTYWHPIRFVPVSGVIRINTRKSLVKRILNWLRGVK